MIELRIHVGAGYRVYCGRHGRAVVVLLCGGDKGSQAADIKRAKQWWSEWKERQTKGVVSHHGREVAAPIAATTAASVDSCPPGKKSRDMVWLAYRTFSTDNSPVMGNNFIRKVKALGKRRGLTVAINASRGKGSHQTLYYGTAFTVVRNPKDELKTGTLHAMCAQLGIKASDL